MYVEALLEHADREAFGPSFFPESPLPWPCGCFWKLSKEKSPGYYWPSLEVELCPLFSEFSMTAFPLQLLCNFEIPIITEGRGDLFSLLLCHRIARTDLLYWRASRTREMICSFENPSGGVPYADEKVGRELTAGTSILHGASCNVCFSLKHARLSWARCGTYLQNKNGLNPGGHPVWGGGGMECRPVIILCTSGQGLAEVWVGLVKIRD